jgi:7,8-dihydro-6-hydroxymethylpterin-pyrophosphokinase
VTKSRASGRIASTGHKITRGGRSDQATFSTAYLGLGSNVGDRRPHLQAAVDALPAQGAAVLESSSVYETEPVGEVLDQPPFLNACVRVETALGPE